MPGLTLAEPDFITLALELAVRELPDWRQVLEAQAARIQNPDRKAQFEFVRPALAADVATRDAFFTSLRDVKNRGRETWVLQGLGYLHHPLRAPSAEKHIGASLELLREIQRTGDIFFPKRWMDATLSGHQSAQRRARGQRLSERVAEGISGAAAARHPVVGRRPDARTPHPGTVTAGVCRTRGYRAGATSARLREPRRRTNRMPMTPSENH